MHLKYVQRTVPDIIKLHTPVWLSKMSWLELEHLQTCSNMDSSVTLSLNPKNPFSK